MKKGDNTQRKILDGEIITFGSEALENTYEIRLPEHVNKKHFEIKNIGGNLFIRDTSNNKQPTMIRVENKPLHIMKTSEYYDLGSQVFIHVIKAVAKK